MSLRKQFISLSSPFSSVLPLSLLTAVTGHRFIIPFYHIVSDEDCPHVRHLYTFKNVSAFEKDLDYLAMHYLPIGAGDLDDVLSGKYRGKHIMLLTFDDGLRQMYDVVAPILTRKGIPAIFFLNNNFIDNKDLMFRYQASLLKAKGHDITGMLEITAASELAVKLDDGQRQILTQFLSEYKPYMTSEQVRALMQQGFAIGAHSMDHPYYYTLTPEAQLDQTLRSIDDLQQRFGISQRLFAFPFTDHGVSRRFFDEIFSDRQVDFSFGGAGIKNDIYPRQLQRVPMEGWAAGAEQTLKSEYLYYLLRMPLMKNSIKR